MTRLNYGCLGNPSRLPVPQQSNAGYGYLFQQTSPPVFHGAQGLSCALQSFLFTITHPPKTAHALLPTSLKPYKDPITSCDLPSLQPLFFWELAGEGSHRIVNNRSSPFGCVRLPRTPGLTDKETISAKRLDFVPAIYWFTVYYGS